MTREPTSARGAASSAPMTDEQRSAFERDGYLIIWGALTGEVAAVRDAIDRTYAAMARAGSLGPDGSMHLLSAVANCPEVAGLIDHPTLSRLTHSVAASRRLDAPDQGPPTRRTRRGGRAGFDFLVRRPTPATPSHSRRSSRISKRTLGHAFVLGACHPRWRTPADVRIH